MSVQGHAPFVPQTGKPTELDLSEPPRVADAVAKMGLQHRVLTSVARDDLCDGGAKVWAATIRAVRYRNPSTAIEVLVPDFKGKFETLDLILDANLIFSTITSKPSKDCKDPFEKQPITKEAWMFCLMQRTAASA